MREVEISHKYRPIICPTQLKDKHGLSQMNGPVLCSEIQWNYHLFNKSSTCSLKEIPSNTSRADRARVKCRINLPVSLCCQLQIRYKVPSVLSQHSQGWDSTGQTISEAPSNLSPHTPRYGQTLSEVPSPLLHTPSAGTECLTQSEVHSTLLCQTLLV